jgi:hypothetical protein
MKAGQVVDARKRRKGSKVAESQKRRKGSKVAESQKRRKTPKGPFAWRRLVKKTGQGKAYALDFRGRVVRESRDSWKLQEMETLLDGIAELERAAARELTEKGSEIEEAFRVAQGELRTISSEKDFAEAAEGIRRRLTAAVYRPEACQRWALRGDGRSLAAQVRPAVDQLHRRIREKATPTDNYKGDRAVAARKAAAARIVKEAEEASDRSGGPFTWRRLTKKTKGSDAYVRDLRGRVVRENRDSWKLKEMRMLHEDIDALKKIAEEDLVQQLTDVGEATESAKSRVIGFGGPHGDKAGAFQSNLGSLRAKLASVVARARC